MQLEHSFQRKGKAYILFLLNGVNTFQEFDKRLRKLPEEVYRLKSVYVNSWSEEKIMGDCFEWFGEAFLKILGIDGRIGITDYHPISAYEDEGTDGVGIGMNLLPAAIQFKYKSNHTDRLTNNADHLGNFTTDAFTERGVSVTTTKLDSNLTIITTAQGLHQYSSEHGPAKHCRVIAWDDLNFLTFDHKIFWDKFREIALIDIQS